MIHSRFFVIGLVLFAVLAPVGSIQSAEIPRQLKIGNDTLSLNGTGVRKKSLLKLYSAGLYLKERSADSAQILGADETMSIRIEVTSKFVSRAKMITALKDGFQLSTNGNTREIQDKIDEFTRCFSDEIRMGDTFDLIYVPNNGVIVLKNGERKGTIQDLAFKQALYGIWLSNRPVDAGLKRGLLGR